MQTREAQPSTGSPQISLRTMTKMIAIKETNVRKIPPKDAIDNGVWEKLTMPSRAYLNSFQKLHLVSPATRSTFS